MNTSFPSAASDFGALLAGGSQTNTNAQLKGILAGRGGAKPPAMPPGASAKSNFERMLDVSPTPTNAILLAPKVPAGKLVLKTATALAEAETSTRDPEASTVVTTTLQIRGMVIAPCQPALIEPAIPPAEEGDPAPGMAPEGESDTDSQPANSPVTEPSENGSVEVPVEPVDGTEVSPETEAAHGPALPREVKLLPGRGHSTRGRGWNPALVQHTGVCGKSVQPPKAETPRVNVTLPAVGCSAPSAGSLPPVAPDAIIGAIAGVVLPVELAPVGTETADQPNDAIVDSATDANAESGALSGSSEPAVISAGVTDFQIADDAPAAESPALVEPTLPNIAPISDPSTPLPTGQLPISATETAFEPGVSSNEEPVQDANEAPAPAAVAGVEPSSPAVPPAGFIPVTITPAVPAAVQVAPAAGSEVTATEIAVNDDVFAPVLAEVEESAAIAPAASAQDEETLVTPELRREVVETVAAMLAPFFANLPVIQPDLAPAADDGAAADADGMAGGSAAVNSTVTITIGDQPSFAFELPQVGLPQADSAQTANGELATASNSTGEGESEVASDPLAGSSELPAVFSRLSEETDPVDFKVQLKARIESAWQRAVEPMPDDAMVATRDPLIDDSLTVDHPGFGRAVASMHSAVAPEKMPQDTTGFPRIAPATPVAPADSREQPVYPESPSTPPLDVVIKMPGFGLLTAQLVASDKAAGALLKKSGTGLGRAEKTAGESTPSELAGELEYNYTEKTFLTPPVQPVKPKVERAGTAVAISDDTMPAKFTAHRVTVDPLEFPARLNAREIQPSFNASQNFPVAHETPVEATPPPVLAHRAVETILNVVEAQRQSASNATSVNLHFKFGTDDLSVRVQMRGGEVLTQFLTDSAELRSALSNEWQTVAGQGIAAGLRMQDPLILPASAGTSSGFGSAAQGQNQARQQAQQQQQEHAAAMMPEVHAFRRGSTPSHAPSATATPRVSFVPSTSQHLTATA